MKAVFPTTLSVCIPSIPFSQQHYFPSPLHFASFTLNDCLPQNLASSLFCLHWMRRCAFFLFSVATLHYAIRRKNDLLTDQMNGIFANSRTLHGLEEPTGVSMTAKKRRWRPGSSSYYYFLLFNKSGVLHECTPTPPASVLAPKTQTLTFSSKQ